MSKSDKLCYIPFYPDGLTSYFPLSFPRFFRFCLYAVLKEQQLGQDGHELCVECPPHLPPKCDFRQYLAMER